MSDGEKERIADALEERKTALGLETIKEFAEWMGKSPSTVGHWINARKLPSEANRIELRAEHGVKIPTDLLPSDSSQLDLEAAEGDVPQQSVAVTPRAEGEAGLPQNSDEMTEVGEIVRDIAIRTMKGDLQGRSPLFVLGAGISEDQVPFLAGMVNLLRVHLRDYLEERDTDVGEVDGDLRKVVEFRNLCVEVWNQLSDGRTIRRDDVAALFSNLTNASALSEIHSRFSRDLLEKGNSEVGTKAMMEAVPTAAHRRLAHLLKGGRAFALSLNFDRLTWIALHDIFGKGVVLHDPDEIRRYYSAQAGNWIPSVIQMRGDVLSRVCTETGCPHEAFPVPVPRGIKGGREEEVSSRELVCPECGARSLVAELSFPGERRKEEQSRETLKQLTCHLSDRVSCVVFVGFSGRWDAQLLGWAFDFCKTQNIPSYHIKKTRSESFISGFQRHYYPECLSTQVVVCDKDRFFDMYDKHLKTLKIRKPKWLAVAEEVPDAKNIDSRHYNDEVWFDESSGLKIPIKDGTTIEVKEADLQAQFCPVTVYNYLDKISQLTLVDKLVTGGARPHSRWDHSVGTAIVGSAWFRRIEDDIRQSARVPAALSEVLEWLLREALLIHDCGHLPFSHVAERVLERINWVPKDFEQLEMDVLRDRMRTAPATSAARTAGDPALQGIVEFVRRAIERTDVPAFTSDEVIELISRAARGRTGWPWFNAICNSPIDADKIDYLTRDRIELSLGGKGSPLGGRLGLLESGGRKLADRGWMSDFLRAQSVNSHGALVVEGKSAVAVADLWSQRINSYARFYYAPEMRVYERIAAEFVEQYVIRYVMGRHQDWDGQDEDYVDVVSEDSAVDGEPPIDLRRAKERIVRRHLERLLHQGPGGSSREKALLESFITKRLVDQSEGKVALDGEYHRLLKEARDVLHERVSSEDSGWPDEALDYIVGEPLYVRGVSKSQVLESIRPIQHKYSREVLVDIVSSPRALSGSPTGHVSGVGRVFGNIIVPEGGAENWDASSSASVPLSDESVKSMEDSVTQIVVVNPRKRSGPRTRYAFDQVREACRDLGAIFDRGGVWNG